MSKNNSVYCYGLKMNLSDSTLHTYHDDKTEFDCVKGDLEKIVKSFSSYMKQNGLSEVTLNRYARNSDIGLSLYYSNGTTYVGVIKPGRPEVLHEIDDKDFLKLKESMEDLAGRIEIASCNIMNICRMDPAIDRYNEQWRNSLGDIQKDWDENYRGTAETLGYVREDATRAPPETDMEMELG